MEGILKIEEGKIKIERRSKKIELYDIEKKEILNGVLEIKTLKELLEIEKEDELLEYYVNTMILEVLNERGMLYGLHDLKDKVLSERTKKRKNEVYKEKILETLKSYSKRVGISVVIKVYEEMGENKKIYEELKEGLEVDIELLLVGRVIKNKSKKREELLERDERLKKYKSPGKEKRLRLYERVKKELEGVKELSIRGKDNKEEVLRGLLNIDVRDVELDEKREDIVLELLLDYIKRGSIQELWGIEKIIRSIDYLYRKGIVVGTEYLKRVKERENMCNIWYVLRSKVLKEVLLDIVGEEGLKGDNYIESEIKILLRRLEKEGRYKEVEEELKRIYTGKELGYERNEVERSTNKVYSVKIESKRGKLELLMK